MRKTKEEEIKIEKFFSEGSLGPIFFSNKSTLINWKESKQKSKFFLAKDNFWSKNFPTTASSLFLSNFIPGESATVIKLLQKKGYKLLGKSILDEFACGGTGLFSSSGEITNPHNKNRIVGGSSSGSAFAVAKNIVPFAIGHDAGDSVRRPSSYCGIIGFKPSYGLISRYGMIPMASSFDTVGIIALKLSTIKKVFKIIAKVDKRDLITLLSEKKKKEKANFKKIAIIEGIENFISREYRELYVNVIKFLENSNKYKIEKVKLPKNIRDYLQLSYLILCSSELASHLGSLQGITYGNKNFDLDIKENRSKFIGKWTKERILIGSYFLSQSELLLQAKKFRHRVQKWTKKLFSNFGFLVFPGTRGSAHEISSLLKEGQMNSTNISHWSDNLLLISNLSGNPSINIPIGKENKMPVSINIDSSWKNDQAVIKLADFISKNVKI